MLQLLLGSETVARLSKRGNRVLRHLLKDSRRVLPSTLLGQLYFVILFTPSLLKFVIKMELLLSKVIPSLLALCLFLVPLLAMWFR